jgi:hypothetical protein
MRKCDPGDKGEAGLPGILEERVDLQYEEPSGNLVTNNVRPAILFVDAASRRIGVRHPDGTPGEYFVNLDSVLGLLRKCTI